MKAAIVTGPGKTPIYGDFPDPVPSVGESLVSVSTAALSRFVRGRASGALLGAPGAFPFVAGVDGVGTLENGQRVYFMQPRSPFGSIAQKAVIKASQCIPLPDGLGDVLAAAIANPGMSCWGAFKERAKLQAGETVLINGATGTAGRLAVQVAKYLGAKKVIATGLNPESLGELVELGADITVPLVEDGVALEDAFKEQFSGGIDVVLDYVWGPSGEHLLAAAGKAGSKGRRLRYVQVGTLSGIENVTVPGTILRSIPLEIMGSGFGSISFDNVLKGIGELLNVTVAAGFKISTKNVPLPEVEAAWSSDTGMPRTVFTIDPESDSRDQLASMTRPFDVIRNKRKGARIMSKIKIAIITGSTRPGRNNSAVADWVLSRAKARTGADYELVDIAAYDLALLDEPAPASMNHYSQEHTKTWSAKIGGFDGFIFVSPEYNHSYSGALKNAIDFLFQEWSNKAAGFVSYGGSASGARGVEHLRPVLAAVGLATVQSQVLLSLQTDFEGFKTFKPAAFRETDLVATFDQVETWAKALQSVRFANMSPQ